MSYFTDEYLKFFIELDKNNAKPWFDQNRDRYEKFVKEPFKQLVEEMIVRIHSDNPDVLISPAEAMFRINRDIRFAKDKTPYKTHMAAMISVAGRKAMNIPGFYFQIGKNGIRIYCGVYDLNSNNLEAIRKKIASNLKLFEKIIKEKKFTDYFHEIRGEKHKRIPPEFKHVIEQQPLIANKNFYVFSDLDSKLITQRNLADKLMDTYFAARPFHNFLSKAFLK